MVYDRWAEAVREQVALGGLLPLGTSGDTAWLTEYAARDALRRTVEERLPAVRLGRIRFTAAEDDGEQEPDPQERDGQEAAGPAPAGGREVQAPPGALPRGPLRIGTEFTAPARLPLPETAGRLREVLHTAGEDGLGLPVTAVDLRVTGLLGPGDEDGEDGEGSTGDAADAKGTQGTRGHGASTGHRGALPDAASTLPGTATDPDAGPGTGTGTDATRLAAAVRAVPGVARLVGRLTARPARVEIAVARDRQPLAVARAVQAAAAGVLRDDPPVGVVVTALA